MPIYNLLEYSQNYFITSGSLWNYYRDEIDHINDNASNGESFKYKTMHEDLHDHHNQIQVTMEINQHDQINHQYHL